ncbi:MAG: methionyl-tRNA formyltransferase [Ignavibacteria bacterium]|nr:methionyl-tRNA formyltransferase [Ignavibacteria bacterium]
MNIIFMGSAGFSIPSLETLYKSKHKIVALVTVPDKEKGRGQKLSASPVKEFGIKNNIPLLQPEKLKDETFIQQLKDFNADLFVVVAFRILPKEVFTIPPKGSFNLHASLLPKYRGAAPVQWALIKGEKKTGVTTFSLEEKVDTGNIYLQKEVIIEDEDNFETLHNKLSEIGAKAVLETVDMIESGNYQLKGQDNSQATPAPKITPVTGKIDWTKPAKEIHNLVRGLSPTPCAYFFHDNKKIKVYKTKVVEKENPTPGKILDSKKNLYVECGKDKLEILELQLEGRKRMSAEEFLRGFRFTK